MHLALERAFKALFVQENSDHPPFTHNLLHLIERTGVDCGEADKMLFAMINEFNLESRYPDEKYELYKKATKSFANKYLLETDRLRLWILEKLKS